MYRRVASSVEEAGSVVVGVLQLAVTSRMFYYDVSFTT